MQRHPDRENTDPGFTVPPALRDTPPPLPGAMGPVETLREARAHKRASSGEKPTGGRKLAGLRVGAVATVAIQVVATIALRVLPEPAHAAAADIATTALLSLWAGATGYMAGNAGEWFAQAWAARGGRRDATEG